MLKGHVANADLTKTNREFLQIGIHMEDGQPYNLTTRIYTNPEETHGQLFHDIPAEEGMNIFTRNVLHQVKLAIGHFSGVCCQNHNEEFKKDPNPTTEGEAND